MIKTVKACGKLYLAGEYAILTAGQHALIKHIPIYMTAQIEPAESYQIRSDMFDYTVDLTPDVNYALIQDTIQVVEEFLTVQRKICQPFHLLITGKLEKNGLKFGIGSSGSVVILTIRAMMALYEVSLSNDLLFKLASYVLIKRGDNGSMGDLACIAYEDLVLYQSFDRLALARIIENQPLMVVLDNDWGYTIQTVTPALSADFLVGWTQQPAISKDMIKAVKSAISEAFLSKTEEAVMSAYDGFVTGQKEQVKKALTAASALLKELSPDIYTGLLNTLTLAANGRDAVAKSSGAGGGDCGIAISFDPQVSRDITTDWKKHGIELLYREEFRSL